MKNITRKISTAVLILSVVFVSTNLMSCKKKNSAPPIIPNEQETITTLIANCTGDDMTSETLLKYYVKDGFEAGTTPPTVVGGTFTTTTAYTASITVLNETVAKTDEEYDTTGEIFNEGTDHQFFYTVTPSDLMTFTYLEPKDANGDNIGLKFKIQPLKAGMGTITITLRHQPDKSATGAKDNILSDAVGGETDIEVKIPVTVGDK